MSKTPNLLAYRTLKSRNLRLSIPKKVMAKLDVGEGDIIGFFDEGGKIVIRKMTPIVDFFT